ncbi:glucosaminidase domain-containing protein [Clostridium lundense]|uniref:glucosaminidase domain-containing protein n=1 Tax=Clostridium lundense TaxID=319475 RepID=UPI0006859596|nr:glucosaminidase domain-containing protein [Clostridium lundense]
MKRIIYKITYSLFILLFFLGMEVKAAGSSNINWNSYYPNYKTFTKFNDVPIDKKFTIRFSKSLDKNLVNSSLIEIKDSNMNSIPITINIKNDKIEVIPKSNLNYGQAYCLIINSNKNKKGWIKYGAISPIKVKTIAPLPNDNTNEVKELSQQEFIDLVSAGAMKTYKKYGVIPSVTIAQAILESNWGKSDKAVQCNNIFGIKADKSWTGEKKELPTTEWINGKLVPAMAEWRAYPSFDESIEDHGQFLYTRPRYADAGVFEATNYKEQIIAIKNAGYATDPKYAEKICSLIERYTLWKYDENGKDLSEKLQ